MHPFLARNFALCLLFAMPMLTDSPDARVAAADVIDVWIGTSQAKPSKGIYHCTLNTKTGTLTEPDLAAEIQGPGFLAMHPDGHHLYAVGSLDGKPSVAAYSIEKSGGKSSLKFDNSLEIGDGGAAHVAVDPTGRTLLTAQYGGGSVAAFSLNSNGSLKERTALIDHQGGSGVVPGRQERAACPLGRLLARQSLCLRARSRPGQGDDLQARSCDGDDHAQRLWQSAGRRRSASHEIPSQRQMGLRAQRTLA